MTASTRIMYPYGASVIITIIDALSKEMIMYPEITMDRFWSKVKKEAHGCWHWMAARQPSGHGVFALGKENGGGVDRAHRVIYEHLNGPVKKGNHVRHLCNVPYCVNPAHLREGTPYQNILDKMASGMAKGGANKGERNPRAIINETTAKTIIDRLENGERQIDIARSLGLKPHIVKHIARGRTWKYLKGELDDR